MVRAPWYSSMIKREPEEDIVDVVEIITSPLASMSLKSAALLMWKDVLRSRREKLRRYGRGADGMAALKVNRKWY